MPTTTLAPIDAATFKALFRHYPNGVAIITAAGAAGPVGFTATSVASVSADPAVLAFSVTHQASAWPTLREAEAVAIHFLDAEHLDLGRTFAARGIDRFDGARWRPLPGGAPRLLDVPTWTHARVLERVEAGGSTVLLAQPIAAEVGTDRTPLVYHDRTFHQLGEGSTLRSA